MGRICFVFLDGVGVGDDQACNPFAVVPTPNINRLLGNKLVAGSEVVRQNVLFKPVDAQLGVDGMPQSATGQTSLFTGINAPTVVGAHLSAYPTAPLREILRKYSLLKQATDNGYRATFANAFSDEYWQRPAQQNGHHSASTLSNMAAGLPFRTLDDLNRREALSWDITNASLREYLKLDIPQFTPEEAGQILADLSARYDLVLYESFLTDLVGHQRLTTHSPSQVLDTLDRFIGSVCDHLDQDATLVICSDHGNIEDTRTTAHTGNPVPLIALGAAALKFAECRAITDVTPAIMRVLTGGRHLPE
jgi:2,3-bisphosphoglycerate-independent phosphoglycerate mutase